MLFNFFYYIFYYQLNRHILRRLKSTLGILVRKIQNLGTWSMLGVNVWKFNLVHGLFSLSHLNDLVLIREIPFISFVNTLTYILILNTNFPNFPELTMSWPDWHRITLTTQVSFQHSLMITLAHLFAPSLPFSVGAVVTMLRYIYNSFIYYKITSNIT